MTLAPPGRVLVVDDEPLVVTAYGRVLRRAGFHVEVLGEAQEAVQVLATGAFDVLVSDISMPRMDGLALLRSVRAQDPDLPVVLMTARGDLNSAVQAVEHGALRYLLKPVDHDELILAVEAGVRRRRELKSGRLVIATAEQRAAEQERLRARFDRAVLGLRMAFQPILRWSTRTVSAFEALVRTDEPTLLRPDVLFAAARELGQLRDLGRAIRRCVADALRASPAPPSLLVNIHPSDLLDEDLYDAAAPLSQFARGIVVEITEVASLDDIADIEERLGRLRALGYQVALDDLGSGYAGLSSFVRLRPAVVKLDMSLTRDIDGDVTKQKLVGLVATLCRDLGIELIAEGIETPAERDTLVALGCDLLQGYLFGRPAPAFT